MEKQNTELPVIQGTEGSKFLAQIISIPRAAAEGYRKTISPYEEAKQRQFKLKNKKTNTDPLQNFFYRIESIQIGGGFGLLHANEVITRLYKLKDGITELNLSNSSAVDELLEALTPYLLSPKCTIRELKLYKTRISSNGVKELAKNLFIGNIISLKKIWFSEKNPIVIDSIRINQSGPKELELKNLGYGVMDAAFIGSLMEKNISCERFDFSNNPVMGEDGFHLGGLSVLFRGLKECQTLIEIRLCHLHFHSEGLLKLIPVIESNSHVQIIDITDNEIALNSSKIRSNTGIREFCKAFKNNKSITQLNISKNQLDYDDAELLCEIFYVNDTLIDLNISDNPLCSSGIMSLCKGLRVNKIIQHIHINQVNIDCDGMMELSECLRKYNTTLKTINLSYNEEIKRPGLQALCEALKINPSIIELKMDGIKKYKTERRQIEQLILSNNDLLTIRQDLRSFNFNTMNEFSITNFVSKLHHLTDSELYELTINNPTFQSLRMSKDHISLIRYYSTTNDSHGTRNLLNSFSARDRLTMLHEMKAKQEKSQQKKQRRQEKYRKQLELQQNNMEIDDESDSDDSTIWDQPLQEIIPKKND